MSTAVEVAAPHRPRRKKVNLKHVRARRATEGDAEVGRRVRTRRLEKRLSQTELASQIGVTFQQVQKYEKGANRIGAGRLQRISEALDIPVSYFFDAKPGSKEGEREPAVEGIFALMQSKGAVRITQAYSTLKSRKARQLLVELVEEMVQIEQEAGR